MLAYILYKFIKMTGRFPAMRGVHFIPKIPGKKNTAATPATGSKRQSVFNCFTGLGAYQPVTPFSTGPSMGVPVGMMRPAPPHPKRVIRSEQHPQTKLFTKGK